MKNVSIEKLPLNSLGLPTRWWGDVALFSVSDGLVLMDYCEKSGIAVLGVEGFRLKEGSRVPDMDCIADFSELAAVSGAEFQERSIFAMKGFLSSMPEEDLFLEFVLVIPH
jgi:hypothetical protein